MPNCECESKCHLNDVCVCVWICVCLPVYTLNFENLTAWRLFLFIVPIFILYRFIFIYVVFFCPFSVPFRCFLFTICFGLDGIFGVRTQCVSAERKHSEYNTTTIDAVCDWIKIPSVLLFWSCPTEALKSIRHTRLLFASQLSSVWLLEKIFPFFRQIPSFHAHIYVRIQYALCLSAAMYFAPRTFRTYIFGV